MARLQGGLILILGFGGIGCAPTTAPSPPLEERLVVLNAGDNTLSFIPVDSSQSARTIILGPSVSPARDVAVRNDLAVIAGGAANEVVVVGLRSGQVRIRVTLPAGAEPTAVAILDDRIAYVANAGLNTVTRIDVITGDTASVAVGQYPRDLLLARGRLFVVNGNVEACALGTCSLGTSWLTVIDPVANTRAAGRDSIPLPSQGNARSATLGGDGLIYVVHTGDVETATTGRLTIVDPVARDEVGSFGGFGLVPASLASDGGERLFITSTRDGLMEFNTRSRRVVRGSGEGVSISDNVAVAVDSQGRVYAVDSGGCQPGARGRIRVFRPDLTEAKGQVLGNCPIAAAVVQLPGLQVPQP